MTGVAGHRTTTVSTVVGRMAEMRSVRHAVAAAGEAGGVLVVRGEPGIGKSSLLDHARREASGAGVLVLGTRGVAPEQHVPYAGLAGLLRPVLGSATRLPPGHRAALDAALGRSSARTTAVSTFVLALSVLELVEEASQRKPVLLIVDDAQWLDDASAEVVQFVGRRMTDIRAALIVATRVLDGPSMDFGATSQLRLAPLSEADSRHMLGLTAPDLSDSMRDGIIGVAEGNPLALLELPVAARKGVSLDGDAALTDRLERVFAAHFDLMPHTTRTLLVALATRHAGDDVDPLRVAAVQLRTELPPDSWEPASRGGLVSTDTDRITFRHPLIASAVRRRAGCAGIRAAHTAWAQVSTEPDRAVWHRASATPGTDGDLAATLESAAQRMEQQGAPATASRWLQRAAELSPQPAEQEQRMLRAGEIAYEVGRYADVEKIMADLAGRPLDSQAQLRLLWLQGAFDDGDPGDRDGIRRLVHGAHAARSDDTDLALQLLLAAAKRCWWGGLHIPEVHAAAHALSLAPEDPRIIAVDASSATMRTGREVLARLDAWAVSPPAEADSAALLATAAFNLADFDRALLFADNAVDVLRRQGRLSTLAQMQVTRAWAALFVGRWDLAYTAADEAFRLGTETRQPIWAAHALLGRADLEGRLGNTARANSLVEQAERLALATGRPTVLGGVEFTKGVIELGNGRPDIAFEHLFRTLEPGDRAFHSVERLWLLDYASEAASLCGRSAQLRDTVNRIADEIAEVPSPGYHQALCLARMHLGDDDDIDDLAVIARAAPGRMTSWYTARVDLVHGSSLRRRNGPADARRMLRAAMLAFDELGAREWSRRARSELATAGADVDDEQRRPWQTLSPQELQIAQLAAEGMTNREIGDRLFLSHRTVGSHLYRMFPKLGITSRAQLHRVLAVPR